MRRNRSRKYERDFGNLKGHPYERLSEAPGFVESLDDVRKRAIAAIDSLRVRYPGREIVVVSHGAVIQAVCAHITGEWSEESVPPNCGPVMIGYDAQGWQLAVKPGDWDTLAATKTVKHPS